MQFDCTRYGGFSEALRIARHAQEKGVLIAPHSAAHIQAHIASAFGDAAFGAESSATTAFIRSTTASSTAAPFIAAAASI